MGGQDKGATPTTPAGYTGGSVADFTPPAYSASPVQPSGFNWSGLGQAAGAGLSNFGASMAAPQPMPQFSLGSGIQTQGISAPQVQSAGIPATGQSNQDEVFAQLRELLDKLTGYA